MLVQRAEEFARLVHRNQFYGERPYVNHLKEVYLTLLDFGVKDGIVLAAAWLLGSLEDTETTYNTLETQFGEEIADIVQRVTNKRGYSREQILEKTAPKVKKHYAALTIKLADRIVNTEFSINNNLKLYQIYKDEFPKFKELLYREEEKDEIILDLWKHLSKLYNPWVVLAGKYEDDPYYGEVLAHIEESREELDEEVGRYYDDCYEIVEERMYDQ
jgi:Guanosine polyphosphate pyrophosphohydrolases/synthetases